MEELNGLWNQKTFREGSPPEATVLVKTRFAFEIKRGADGSVERYKSRLVAKGFPERSGVSCFLNIKTLDFQQGCLNTPRRGISR